MQLTQESEVHQIPSSSREDWTVWVTHTKGLIQYLNYVEKSEANDGAF